MVKVAQTAFAIACSEACQTSTRAQVAFKWLHIRALDKQTAGYM